MILNGEERRRLRQVTRWAVIVVLAATASSAYAQTDLRKTRYEAVPIKNQIRSGDRHVILVDDRFMTADGPLLSVPPKPYKYPDVLRELVHATQAAVIAEVVRSQGALNERGDYIHSTITYRVDEIIRAGATVRIGSELQAQQDGGTVTLEGVQVDLVPSHIWPPDIGKRFLIFVKETSSRLEAVDVYALTADGHVKTIDLVKRPKGYGDPIDGRTLTEVRKRIKQYSKPVQ